MEHIAYSHTRPIYQGRNGRKGRNGGSLFSVQTAETLKRIRNMSSGGCACVAFVEQEAASFILKQSDQVSTAIHSIVSMLKIAGARKRCM